MTAETITITEDIRLSEEEDVRIEYYTLDGKRPEIFMPPGDLMIIANVLHDYSALLMELLEQGTQEENIVSNRYLYEYHANRCKKIQSKIENAMNYSTEKAIIKCRKKHKSDKDDVGEDAMVLAVKARRAKSAEHKKEEEPPKEKNKSSTGIEGQMNFSDLIGG